MPSLRILTRLLTVAALLLLVSSVARCQFATIDDTTSVPIPGVGHDYIKLFDETVNPANGSVSLRIQVPVPKGRGITLPFGFNYDTNGVIHLVGQGAGAWRASTAYLSQGGWSYAVPRLDTNGYSRTGGSPPQSSWTCSYATDYVFGDANGGRHPLGVGSATVVYSAGYNVCNPTVFTGGDEQTVATLLPNQTYPPPTSASVADRDGNVYYFSNVGNHGVGGWSSNTSLPTYVEDRNGNKVLINDTISINGTPNNAGIFTTTDSVGRTAISSSGFGPSGTTNSVTVSGLSNPYKITWETVSASYNVPIHVVYVNPGTGACPGLTGGISASLVVVKSITLPNGEQYQFSYDPTYGLISEIIYPTGAWVKYTWKVNPASEYAGFPTTGGQTNGCDYQYGTPVLATRTVSFNGSSPALTQTFSNYTTTWASGDEAWTAKSTTVSSTDNILGKTAQTIYTYGSVLAYAGGFNDPFTNIGFSVASQTPAETSVAYYDWGNTTTPLRTVNKTWYEEYAMANEQTILDNQQSSNVVNCYVGTNCAPNIPIQLQTKSEYGFTGSNPVRTTTYTYQSFSNTLGPISERPCSVVVSGASGALAETDNYFDGSTTLCGAISSGASTAGVSSLPLNSHDETNFGPSSSTPRGNATQITKKCFVGAQSCTNSTTTATYDETGQILTSVNACGNASCSDVTASSHTTTYSYADNYDSPPSSNTNAYLTKITNPLGQSSSFEYAYSDGQLLETTDPNGLVTQYAYNDSLRRLTSTTNPDGGITTNSYNDTPPTPSVSTSKQINASESLATTSIMDGIGHVTRTELTSDPQNTVYTDTAYDGVGNVYTVSNPYRSCSIDPTSSCGTTTYLYDALKRKKSATYPDGSVLTTAYCGPTTLVTDPTARWRRSTTDGLGRLIEVDEPNSPSATVSSNGCPGNSDPIWVTSYTLDPLNNLTNVLQNGSHARTFTYDSLSRLLTSTNPEVGTITYTYDANGNVQTKTDARGIVATYGYEALNREISSTYSNGDPTISLTYDQSACLGLTTCQNIGHSTSMTDAAGSEAWSYQVDKTNLRSIHADQRTITSGSYNITKTAMYYMDLAGNVTQEVYPTGRIVNYKYDAANRPMNAVDGSNGITYATDWQTGFPPGCIATAVCYTPQGSLYGLSVGQTSTFAGLNISNSYNTRLQPQEFKASSSAGNAIDITYSFVDPTTTKNAGHVNSVTNNLDSTRSQSFSYDQVNRITSAQTTSTYSSSPTHCWAEVYALDAWANLQSIAQSTNSNFTGCSQESGFTSAADGNNHIPAFNYDASGNATSDGTYAYTWDGESQLKSAGGVTYLYDGDGRRVEKVGSKLYWYGARDDIIGETDPSGNTTAEYVFFGGKRVAMIPASDTATDGGFEAGLQGWVPWGSGISAQLITTPSLCYSGNNCLQLSNSTSGSSGDDDEQEIPLSIGQTISISGWVYQQSGGNGGGEWLAGVYAVNGNSQGAIGYMEASPSSVTGTWVNQTASYTVPSWVVCPCYAKLYVQLATGSTANIARFDAATVSVTGGTPLTGPLYYVEDSLGTSRVITNASGTVCYDADFYPYGGERPYTNNCPQNYKFEGKERDAETGNDNFGARYYSNRYGRWLSADWSATPVAVPYANLTNPQTLNLYTMVSDDPETSADLDGHECSGTLSCTFQGVVSGAEAGDAVGGTPAAILGGIIGGLAGGLLGYEITPNTELYVNHPSAAFGDPMEMQMDMGSNMSVARPGTKGQADHQQTVQEEVEKMGEGAKPEDTIPTPGGEKGSRRGDAVKRDADGKVVEVRQVIRPNKNGTPPAREIRAANDIEKATGVKVTFVPVRPIIPPPRSIMPPDEPSL